MIPRLYKNYFKRSLKSSRAAVVAVVLEALEVAEEVALKVELVAVKRVILPVGVVAAARAAPVVVPKRRLRALRMLKAVVVVATAQAASAG